MINNIILDSNAFFKSNRLLELVKDTTPYTTPEVMQQLKDQKTKQILESFPFKIQVRQPSKEAIKFVKKFSVLTGDSASLSDTDIGVIALTYDLIEKIGMKNKLNEKPRPFQVHKQSVQKDEYTDDQSIDSVEKQQVKVGQSEQAIIKQQNLANSIERIEQLENPISAQKKEVVKPEQKQSHQAESNNDDDGWIQVKPKKRKVIKTKESGLNDWITPTNYQQKKSKGLLNIQQRQISSIPQSDIPVWLITGDFSMQNVAMTIGIPTKSSDGNQIFSLKRYIQMCYACGQTIKDNLDKITTCTKCGYNTLSKVAYTIDQSGNMILHKKKNWTPNNQVFEWKQKKLEEQAKNSKYQRKKKAKAMFE